MGLNRQLANLPDAITTDTSNNVGIGGSPSGSYKLDVTGTGRFTGALNGTSGSFSGIIDASSAFIGGSGQNIGALTPKFQVLTNVAADRNNGLVYFANDANSSILSFAKSRSGTIGTITYPIAADFLGRIFFTGASESSARFDVNATIDAIATSTWSGTNRETKLEFYTTANGATARGLALTINGDKSATFSSLGTGTVTATSGTLSTVSDMNLKVEDGFIDNALGKVMNLKPRYFHWKEESGLPTDLRQLGFYAQEVNAALGEEAANTPKTENDKWGIYDRGIIAMLTKAIQEQNQTITSLQDRLDKLENK